MQKLIKGALLSITGLLIAAAFPLSALAATTVTVTPDNPDGWATTDSTTPGGMVNYSTQYGAPQNLGSGALLLTTNDASSHIQYFHGANDISLNNLDVSYYTYRDSASNAATGQLAALNMVIDYNGGAAGGFDTLVFEPIYQTGIQIQTDQWQKWDASGSGIWWSTRAINGVCATTCYVSLDSIAAANPNAVVQAFGLNQGSGNAELTTAVDGLTFNGWQYDFEPYIVAKDSSSCKNNGYKDVRDNEGNVFKNQGACVSWVQHNVNGNGNSQNQANSRTTNSNNTGTSTGTF